jgi:hypothetical protein
MQLTTQLHLVLRSKMLKLYLPAIRLHGVVLNYGEKFYFLNFLKTEVTSVTTRLFPLLVVARR